MHLVQKEPMIRYQLGELKMNTFNIQISEDQLNIIKSALQKDSSYSESEELIIGMIQDILESKDSEISHGICY